MLPVVEILGCCPKGKRGDYLQYKYMGGGYYLLDVTEEEGTNVTGHSLQGGGIEMGGGLGHYRVMGREGVSVK